VLSIEEPDREPSDHFTYDPMNPVPTAPEAGDQSLIEKRRDVLVYTTPVLEKGAEVTGPIEVVLYVSSSAKDTDFTAKLVNLAPDGKAYILQQGILRARYREGFEKKVWMNQRVIPAEDRPARDQQLFSAGTPYPLRGFQQCIPNLRAKPEHRRPELQRNPVAGGRKSGTPFEEPRFVRIVTPDALT
jgi:putative CocE/NonD family hydrolase